MTTHGWADDTTIALDREGFRAEATNALRQFTPEDRATAEAMETDTITSANILKAWATMYAPICRELDELAVDKRFRQYIVRHVKFSESEAEASIGILLDGRKSTLLDEVLATIYHDEILVDQRQNAAEFMKKPESYVSGYMDRYTQFIEALEASKKHDIMLCDPHASWLERQRQALQIHKQQAETGRNEDARLKEIEQTMNRMEDDEDSLLGRIVERAWNFVSVLELYRKYKKQLDSLNSEKAQNASARLRLFEKTTASFREEQTEVIANASGSTTLHAVRAIGEDVYNLLLEIFDLSNTARNKLLVDIERYSKLRNERDLILLIQKNREHFLKG
jgi:hypothetical protein